MFGVCAILILVGVVYGHKPAGDNCFTRKNLPGTCTLFKHCEVAKENLNIGILPSPSETCGYVGLEPIVCCPRPQQKQLVITPTIRTVRTTTVATPKITEPISTTTTKPSPTGRVAIPKKALPFSKAVGAISTRMCREYQKYIYDYSSTGGPSEDCALTDVKLIVDGTAAKPKEFPHMALLGIKQNDSEEIQWICGGSLISDEFVLTAAHCVETQNGVPNYIRLGELVLDTELDDAEPQNFNIKEITKHPKYSSPSTYHDIALLRLDRKARLNPYVRPACLNVNSKLDLSRSPLVSGFGKKGFSSDTSKALLYAPLDYYSPTQCNHSYRNNIGIKLRNGILDNIQICAGSKNSTKDTCQGDSGGPLHIIHSLVHCMYSILGVTSFGSGCGVAGIPGVYVRISSYIGWIESTVWK